MAYERAPTFTSQEHVVWTFELAAISAFFAAAAAMANLIQAFRAAQSNEVTVYLQMMEEYASADMRGAISELSKFWREQRETGDSVAEAFTKLSAADPGAASKLRGHCRLISNYFTNAARLREAKLVSPRMLKLLITHPGLNTFYDVAVPINLSKNPHHNSEKYAQMLRRVVTKHGNGIY